jgi:hypothetical protein
MTLLDKPNDEVCHQLLGAVVSEPVQSLLVLGWHISLHRLIDEASVRRSFVDAQFHSERKAEFEVGAIGHRVAVWQAGLWGLKWIEQAASRAGGVALSRNGYPNWYLVKAADVLPTIRSRRPYEPPMYEYPTWITGEGDVLLPNWLGKTTVDAEAMDRCAPEEWLLVEAWDES